MGPRKYGGSNSVRPIARDGNLDSLFSAKVACQSRGEISVATDGFFATDWDRSDSLAVRIGDTGASF